MKKNCISRVLLILVLNLCNPGLFAQVKEPLLRILLEDEAGLSAYKLKNKALVKEFYSLTGYKAVWTEHSDTTNLALLRTMLGNAGHVGLETMDYQKKISDKNKDDVLHAELLYTDAAMHFFSDMAFGNRKPDFGFDGLKYGMDCYNIPSLLSQYVLGKRLQSLPNYFLHADETLQTLANWLHVFYSRVEEPGFAEAAVLSEKVNASNKPLLKRLYQLGILPAVPVHMPDSILKIKVKEAQRMFNVLDDGRLRKTFIAQLNIPLTARIRQLKLAINYYRWLHCVSISQPVILVNIPSANLELRQSGKSLLFMRVIVGKKSTPTPTLASVVNEVVLYPYWHVPYSIATKELLPLIKRNPGYLNSGNFQVLDRSGRIVNPYKVKWRALSSRYFPYTIRQSTGCDNSLGLLKLNFYSPFGVYLHDTPGKSLFMLNKRYFSHGCIRLEKPMQLGHFLLKGNEVAIDTLEQKGCLRNQSPVNVPVTVKAIVLVWYNLAEAIAEGRIIFYEDVYGKFE